MGKGIEVSVVIINYNTKDLTRQCLKSIFQLTRGCSFEVILVDNASTECQPEELVEGFQEVVLVKSPYNLGFAGGNNLGISKANGRYILLLNSDTELVNDAITIALDYLKQNPKVGVVSGKLSYPSGELQYPSGRFPSLKRELAELFRIPKGLSEKEQALYYLGDRATHDTDMQVDWVWGAFFMFPTEILKKLPQGRLSDTFFMYGEDVLWCKEISDLGYEIWYLHQPHCIHYLSASAGKGQTEKEKHFQKILPNEYHIIERYEGQSAARVFYALRILLLLSLRKKESLEEALRYLQFLMGQNIPALHRKTL